MSKSKDVVNVLENRNLPNLQNESFFSIDGNEGRAENRKINSPADIFIGN